MIKPTRWPVRPAKTRVSVGIRPVWSESSLSAWRDLGSLASHNIPVCFIGLIIVFYPILNWERAIKLKIWKLKIFWWSHLIRRVSRLVVTCVPQCREGYYKTSCSVNNVINQSMFQLYIVFEPRHDKINKSARPAKTQISLGIRLVWSESSLCAVWVTKYPSFLHADSKDSVQIGRMPRLIWVFAGRTVTSLVCHVAAHLFFLSISITLYKYIMCNQLLNYTFRFYKDLHISNELKCWKCLLLPLCNYF